MTRGRIAPGRLASAALLLVPVLGGAAGGCGQSLRDAGGDVGTSAPFGRAGGRLDMAEMHLSMPADAVESDIVIMVRRVSSAEAAVGPVFAFEPADFVFSRPLELAIDLPQPLPLPADRLAVAGLSGRIWRRIGGSAVKDGAQATVAVTQLATFAVVVTCGSNDDCASGSCDTGACQAPPP